jgi:hypothetical protein
MGDTSKNFFDKLPGVSPIVKMLPSRLVPHSQSSLKKVLSFANF